MKKSITWRITIAFAILVSLAVCMAATLTYIVYLQIEKRMIYDLVQTESDRLIIRVSRFGNTWERPFERNMGPSMYAWGESANVRSKELPDALRALPVGLHALEKDNSTWYVAIKPAMDGKLYVLFDTIALETSLRDFALALAAIVLGFSALAILVSSRLARWLVQPLNILTDRLARWSAGFPAKSVRQANEAERLLEVFNHVQDQVDTSIADQREFSANLHHEIRTPLMIIQSDAELLLTGCITDPAQQRARLQRIMASVREINQSLESTFSLAHAQFADRTPTNLHASVDDIFEGLGLEAGKAGLVLINAVRRDHEVTLSHYALMTVLRNIVRNAVLHAAPARLEAESIEQGLQLTDSGPGIAPAELSSIFDRYYSARRSDQRPDALAPAADREMNQTGLGLAIAKRVCVIQGWQLEAASPVADGKGTRFILRFSEPGNGDQTA